MASQLVIWIPVQSLTSCMTLNKILSPSESWFLYLTMKKGRRREWQKMRWLDGNTDSMDMSLNKLQETVEDRGAWRATVYGGRRQSDTTCDWTTTKCLIYLLSLKTKKKERKKLLTCPWRYSFLHSLSSTSHRFAGVLINKPSYREEKQHLLFSDKVNQFSCHPGSSSHHLISQSAPIWVFYGPYVPSSAAESLI